MRSWGTSLQFDFLKVASFPKAKLFCLQNMILVHMDSKSHCDMKSRFRQNQEKNYTLGSFVQGWVLHHCFVFESHSEFGREAEGRNVYLGCV